MVNEYDIKNFEMCYPWYADQVEEYLYGDPLELIVKLKDGKLMSYYLPENELRDIPAQGECNEEMMKEEFGIRLYRRMVYACMLQTRLSEITGIPKTRISDYVRGKYFPSYENLLKIAEALDCDLDYFQIFRKF